MTLKWTTAVSVKQGAVEKKELTEVGLTAQILSIVEAHTAGSPIDEKIKWTYLKPREIAQKHGEAYGGRTSNEVVKRILKQAGYVKRKPSKSIAIGKSPHRKEQFRIIKFLTALFTGMENNPVLSIDTKKKERLGLLTRGQAILSNKNVPLFDHDYDYLSAGKVVPQAIYDTKQNKGYITIGTNYETAGFIADNLIWWWEAFGINLYPDATQVLVLCDSGGANSYRHHAFKKAMLRVAKTIDKIMVVSHYPPYCSKYNPIERRLFCHVERALGGSILSSHEQVKTLFQRTETRNVGQPLGVEVRIEDKQYPIGLKTKKEDIDWDKIYQHPDLPQFNYFMKP